MDYLESVWMVKNRGNSPFQINALVIKLGI